MRAIVVSKTASPAIRRDRNPVVELNFTIGCLNFFPALRALHQTASTDGHIHAAASAAKAASVQNTPNSAIDSGVLSISGGFTCVGLRFSGRRCR